MNAMKARLSAMMFLEFFLWGGWFVTLGTFLGKNLAATGAQSGAAFSTQSWGAIIAPFIIGLIADRFFNAERILGMLHLVGAALLYAMYRSTDFATFYPYVLGYMIAFMPTLALVNSVALRQLSDPAREFGRIRVWGTLGWVIVGLWISYGLKWDSVDAVAAGALRNTFALCAIVSLILGVYSFTLPATPPLLKGARVAGSILPGVEALRLLKDRNFLLFFMASILICIPLAFYYQNTNLFLIETGVANVTGKMAIGQVSEVAFMLALPLFLGRFGIKRTLLLGMAAWALRYGLFSLGSGNGSALLLIAGIALHGVCYDFFFVSGQIYTDFKAGEASRSSAQGLITLATYGVGMLVGFWSAGRISDLYVHGTGHDWAPIWIYPAGFAALVLVLFAILFKTETIRALRTS